MLNNFVIANSLGTIGTILWCIQLVPQIWHNYRKKDTDGLPASMILIWAVSSIPFGTYSIIREFALPLQIQPQMFAFLALITWGQILYYDRDVSFFKALVAVTGLCILIGGTEVVLIFGSELLYRAGINWHTTVLAIFAAILFISGFVPAIVEIWLRRGRVAGISFGFLMMDCMGALFSLAALAFQKEFDYQGGVLYILVVFIEVGIASSHSFWLWRTRDLHEKARLLGVRFDELPEALPYQRHGDKLTQSVEDAPILGVSNNRSYGSVPNNSREDQSHVDRR